LFFLILCSFSAYAQNKTEIFRLPIPDLKISNSLYHSIQILDIRKDTSNYGVLQKGAFNRKAEVVAEPSLGIQLSQVVNALTDKSAQNGKLLLLLRQCRFAEIERATHERGLFHFRAIL